jgi:hypothetical protein
MASSVIALSPLPAWLVEPGQDFGGDRGGEERGSFLDRQQLVVVVHGHAPFDRCRTFGPHAGEGARVVRDCRCPIVTVS